ncbi:MAG: radical SAM protein [bacterium]
MRIALISIYDEYTLGPRYISSVLREDGHETHLILFKGLEYVGPHCVPPPDRQCPDGYYGFCTYTTGKEVSLLLDLLERIDPAWTGFAFASINFGLAEFLTRAVRSRFPKTPIVWGGVDSTFNPEENIQYPDVLCVGEGEYSVREWVHAFSKGEEKTSIPSLWFNLGHGEIRRNAIAPLEQNVDNFPFPDFDIDRKHVILEDAILDSPGFPYPPKTHLHTNFVTMGTRGCPFTCTYCASGHSDQLYPGQKFVRRRSVDNIISELRMRKRTWSTPLERVEFYDDVLPMSAAWVEELSRRMATEIGLPFFGYTHPNVGKPESLQALANGGCAYLIMGIQSGSQRTLEEYYGRRHSAEKIKEAVRNIRDAGMRVIVDLIGWNPLETRNDNIETLGLLLDLPRPFGIIKINPMAYYDHFRIQEIARREDIMNLLERPKGVHAYRAIPKPEYLFWEMLHTLAQFDGLDCESVRGLVDDQYLMENPRFLEQLVEVLYQRTYMDGNPVAYKDDYIAQLRWRLHRIESSSVYKAYRKIKSLRLSS